MSSRIRGPGIAIAALGWLAAMNVLLAAFNLLPGAPLDGGRILRAFLWRRTGDRTRAARSAAAAGRAVGAALVILGTGEVLLWTDAGGLWLALIGMFIMNAAAAEATAGAAAAALAGLRVSDVMTPDPDIGGTWMPVAGLIDQIALRSAQGGFPVISPGGSLAGVTGVGKLAQVPAAGRASTTLGQVMAPVPAGYLAAPQDPAASLLARPPLADDLAAIVMVDGRITGIVTVTRLRQIIRWQALRAHRPGNPPVHAGPCASGRGTSPGPLPTCRSAGEPPIQPGGTNSDCFAGLHLFRGASPESDNRNCSSHFSAGAIAAWRPSTREPGSVTCAGTYDHAAQEE
jgi:Zn-dependent protease